MLFDSLFTAKAQSYDPDLEDPWIFYSVVLLQRVGDWFNGSKFHRAEFDVRASRIKFYRCWNSKEPALTCDLFFRLEPVSA